MLPFGPLELAITYIEMKSIENKLLKKVRYCQHHKFSGKHWRLSQCALPQLRFSPENRRRFGHRTRSGFQYSRRIFRRSNLSQLLIKPKRNAALPRKAYRNRCVNYFYTFCNVQQILLELLISCFQWNVEEIFSSVWTLQGKGFKKSAHSSLFPPNSGKKKKRCSRQSVLPTKILSANILSKILCSSCCTLSNMDITIVQVLRINTDFARESLCFCKVDMWYSTMEIPGVLTPAHMFFEQCFSAL